MKKPRKQTTLKEDAGKLLLDVGKLIFGSVFLGSILRGEMPRVILATGGFVIAVLLCIVGLLMGTKEKKNGENSPTTLARNSPTKQG